MRWQRMGDWWAESDAGYRVAISRDGDGYLYQAYGPPDPDARRRRQARYGIGEAIPREREYLGLARSKGDAVELCEAHWLQQAAVARVSEDDQA